MQIHSLMWFAKMWYLIFLAKDIRVKMRAQTLKGLIILYKDFACYFKLILYYIINGSMIYELLWILFLS